MVVHELICVILDYAGFVSESLRIKVNCRVLLRLLYNHMISDSIGDLLTIIRNGYAARLNKVAVRNSKMARAILETLKNEGYVSEYTEKEREVIVKLRYVYAEDMLKKVPVITHISRVSKPGLRVYKPYAEIPHVRGGLGTILMTTSKGVMTGSAAKKAQLGGEVLCKIW